MPVDAPPTIFTPEMSVYELLWVITAGLGMLVSLTGIRRQHGVVNGGTKLALRLLGQTILLAAGVVAAISPNPLNPTLATYFTPLAGVFLSITTTLLVVIDNQMLESGIGTVEWIDGVRRATLHPEDYPVTSRAMPMCMVCTRYKKGDSGFVCDAYPTGIPMPIILGQIDHRQPHEGDHGLQFEPRDADATAYVHMVYDPKSVSGAT